MTTNPRVYPDPQFNSWHSPGAVGLLAAVLFHGFASLNQHAKPPRPDTVLATAEDFVEFLLYSQDIEKPESRGARSNDRRQYPRPTQSQ